MSLASPFDITTSRNLQVNSAFRDLLLQNGLKTFESFMQHAHVEIVKQAVAERSTVKILLRDGRGESTFFLKRHTAPPLKEYVKLLTRFSWPKSAFNEWRAIIRFHEMKLPTMVPVAAGKKKGRFGIVNQSFVLTEEIKDAKRLDHYLEKWNETPLSPQQIQKKRELIKRLAVITRKMHASGFNHRDYYLCHVFLREREQEEDFELFILDLHRVDIRHNVGQRWVVKDLAALNYSSLELPIHTTDRIRFMKAYLQKSRLETKDRPLLLRVLRKTRKIARHAKRKHA
jgi:heptose I phosphotransferase